MLKVSFCLPQQWRIWISLTTLFMLTACHHHVERAPQNQKYDQLKVENRTNNFSPSKPAKLPAFQHYLAQGYRDLAQQENYEHHFNEELIFARKSERAQAGERVQPHAVHERYLPPWSISELQQAYDKLIQRLNSNMTHHFPYLVAQSQVMFDCWLEEQEENINEHDIKVCRQAFYEANNQLEAQLKNNTTQSMPYANVDKCHCNDDKKAPQIQQQFIIYFDLDSAQLTEASIAIFNQIRDASERLRPKKIVVQGHTDRSGQQSYNTQLSEQRVKATISGLLIAGLSKDKVQAGHFGEDRPRVATPDGKVLAENRRVEIRFEF